MADPQEIMEICSALLDLEVPGSVVAPILRWLADQLDPEVSNA